MGSASRVTPGRLHNDSESASLPIENSPPETHTIPAGALVGAGPGLTTVGAKLTTADVKGATGGSFSLFLTIEAVFSDGDDGAETLDWGDPKYAANNKTNAALNTIRPMTGFNGNPAIFFRRRGRLSVRSYFRIDSQDDSLCKRRSIGSVAWETPVGPPSMRRYARQEVIFSCGRHLVEGMWPDFANTQARVDYGKCAT